MRLVNVVRLSYSVCR